MARPRAAQSSGRRQGYSNLAKLTRPQLWRAIPRLRLFKLLDDARTKPLTWIHGPPGAGKTTLVASYLTANDLSGIWYQADADDTDVASFFYYLGLAAPARDKRGRLPLLNPEHLSEIEGFARRFFRELCWRLNDDSVIVFDNYQEVSATSVFHKIIAHGVCEVPPTIRVIVLSRSEPPPEYARHLANSQIAPIGWDDLRLTLDEAHGIATARLPVSPELVQMLHQQSQGWTAGLVLMLERQKEDGEPSRSVWPDELDTIFNYFAAEIFERLDQDTRTILLETCMLPRVSVDLANALTGRSDAADILGRLHRRQLFVDRRLGETVTYQYHALFQRFLQGQTKIDRTEAEQRALAIASAEMLANDGQIEHAVPLFVASQAWEAAIRLIVSEAHALLALGRWQTVQHWIESLPESIRNTTPWLGFWLGMCRSRIDPARARLDLEPAFALFQQEDDVLGQALAATAIAQVHWMEGVNYRRLDPWIDSLDALLRRRDATLLTLETEFAVRASLFTAIVIRQTYRDDIPHLARQLANILRHDLDPNHKLLAGRGLFTYGAYSCDFVLIDHVARHTESAFNSPAASALNRAWYALTLGFALRYVKESRETSRAWFMKAREIVREHELRFVEVTIAFYWAWAEEVFGQPNDIQRELEIAEAHLNPLSAFDAATRQMARAFLRARQNALGTAVIHTLEAHAIIEQSGLTMGQISANLALAGYYIRDNNFSDALVALEQALRHWFPAHVRDYVQGMFEARIALGVEDEERVGIKLRSALKLGAEREFENTISEHLFRPTTIALCAYALKHDIETDFVKRIIRAQRLEAPSPDIEGWPWRVRIYLLGQFTVQIDEQPMVFVRKEAEKSLQLLKALVTADGCALDVDGLSQQLWPEATGARDLFDITYDRLQRLLPVEDFVLVKDGKLTINKGVVWTDIGAFEYLADLCSRKVRHDPHPDQMAELSERLLSLYRGELLQGEELEIPWLLAARDRVRRHFLETLEHLGTYWAAQTTCSQAQHLWKRIQEAKNEKRATLAVQKSIAVGAWKLTRRQADVLEHVARGLSNKEVAALLGCAENTVELHMTELFKKARVSSRAQLIACFWSGLNV